MLNFFYLCCLLLVNFFCISVKAEEILTANPKRFTVGYLITCKIEEKHKQSTELLPDLQFNLDLREIDDRQITVESWDKSKQFPIFSNVEFAGKILKGDFQAIYSDKGKINWILDSIKAEADGVVRRINTKESDERILKIQAIGISSSSNSSAELISVITELPILSGEVLERNLKVKAAFGSEDLQKTNQKKVTGITYQLSCATRRSGKCTIDQTGADCGLYLE
jgi:hypothetical protein